MKILSRGADHGRSADVDILDQLLERHAGLGGSFLEGVEIHHNHIDRLNAVLADGCDMRGNITPMQNAAMHLGMQRLDPAIEHFRKAGEFGNVFHDDARIAQQLGCPSGGDKFNAEVRELPREVDEASLVGNAENGTLDAGTAAGHDRPRI
jgi:hypothetical protein